MIADRDLFDADLPGNQNMVDPLRGELPDEVLERIIKSPKRRPTDWILKAIREALADRLALRANLTRAEADSVLRAHHSKLRAVLIQAGRGGELGDPSRLALPEGLLAGFGRVTFAGVAAAGDELDRRARELIRLTGCDYGVAMAEAGKADQVLTAIYMGQAAPETAVEDPPRATHRAAIEAIMADNKRQAPPKLRRINPAARIEGQPHLLKLAPESVGGGCFKLEF